MEAASVKIHFGAIDCLRAYSSDFWNCNWLYWANDSGGYHEKSKWLEFFLYPGKFIKIK